MKLIRSITGILLAVVLAATGLSVAHARGQADPAGSMVICRGLTVVTVLVDAEGNPVELPHVCPDAALALFVETGAVTLPSAVALIWRSVDWDQPVLAPVEQARSQVRARGPPASF